MKKLITLAFLIFSSLFTCSVIAQTVTRDQAEIVCKHFLFENYPGASDKMPQISFEQVYDNGGMPFLYRFSIEPAGFLIVSGSQKVMPVLAYSFDDEFEMIPPIESLFKHYQQVVELTEKGVAPTNTQYVSDWNHYLSSNFTPKSMKNASHAPLLTSRWNQNKYYNTYCPYDVNAGSYYDYRVPCGCVATAFTQIMNYHRYPEQGRGATTYIPQGYPRQTVYFNQHSYNWDAMSDEPMSYANELAKIVYHFGVAIQMGYTAEGSGAASQEATNEINQKFLYDQSITTYYRDYYQDSAEVQSYINVLKNDIDLHRPIYYSGCSQNSGCHAYVIDDYDNDQRFHINYGWGGASNGYYAIDNFVSGNTHWDYTGSAVVNIFPSGAYPDTYCQGHQRNTSSFGYVADGSPTAKPYQANPDCSWMVAVPEATSYTFSFDRLDLDPQVDFVTIYNGPTVESGVKGTFTGSTLPTGSYTVQADSVLITFTGSSTSNTEFYGFLIKYTSEVPAGYCNGITNVSEWTAVLSDNSGENNAYRPQSNCTWNVNLNFISGYAFAFPKFNLGYGDFVDVYNYGTNPPTLYKRFDIYNQPESEIFNVTFKKMRVNFVSDNWDQADGFEMRYYAIAGIDDHSGVEDVAIYPNPATSHFFIDYNMETTSTITCRLVDAAGKVVRTDIIEPSVGENRHTVDVSSLAAGFYMLEMITNSGKTIRKVMVR